MELKKTQQTTQQQDKADRTAPLVEWLDSVRGEDSEFQFEKSLGLARNSIRNIREGRLPGYDKLVKIRQGTGVSWEFLGGLLEAPFDPKKKIALVKQKSEEEKVQALQEKLIITISSQLEKQLAPFIYFFKNFLLTNMSASDPRRKLIARYSELEAIASKIGVQEDDLRAWVSGDNRWNYTRGKAHLLAEELGCNVEEIEETLHLPSDEEISTEGKGDDEDSLGQRSHLNCLH